MLETNAQIAEVLETAEPIVFYTDRPSPEMVLEMHEPHQAHEHTPQEVHEPVAEVQFVVQELPGVERLDPEKETQLEVRDDTIESNETLHAKENKKGSWGWEHILEKDGPEGLMAWVKDRLDNVPKHSGYDKAGLLRAAGYLEKLANEVSKAMRLDLDGKLDADKIEALLAEIEDGIERIHDRIDKITSSKKKTRKKKSEFEPDGLVKEAQTVPRISGIVITVPLLIHRLARVCINSMVSAGHDMVDTYEKLCEKFALNEREKAELQQLILDMGYGAIDNRGLIADKDKANTQYGEFDYASSYAG